MAQRRDLDRRLATAYEDERRRVARDLHDSVGQLLAGLSLAFKAVETAGALPPPTAARLAESQRVADALGKEVHALAVRLRPTALDDLGLDAALGQLVSEWSGRTGWKADFQAVGLGPGALTPEVQPAIYRVVREVLTNVARHAQATQASAAVTVWDGHVTAAVEHDGVGFDAATLSGGRLGLLGMRERAALTGGELDIESGARGRTTIVLRFPVREGGGP
jgi:signal transduction histidine kinase